MAKRGMSKKGGRNVITGAAKSKIQKACDLVRRSVQNGLSAIKEKDSPENQATSIDFLDEAEDVIKGLRRTYGARGKCAPNTMARLNKLRKKVERKYE